MPLLRTVQWPLPVPALRDLRLRESGAVAFGPPPSACHGPLRAHAVGDWGALPDPNHVVILVSYEKVSVLAIADNRIFR